MRQEMDFGSVVVTDATLAEQMGSTVLDILEFIQDRRI